MPADPVAVDAGLLEVADALMDRVHRHAMQFADWRSFPYHIEERDLILAALQAAEKRGAERMQERAAKVCDDYLVRMAETIARRTEAGKPSFVAECKEDAAESLAAAIRALPTDKET